MLPVLIASVLSGFTLWLIEHPIKYVFYFFEVSFIVLLYLVYSKNHNVKIELNIKTSLYSLFDFVFVASSLGLLFLNIWQVHTIANIVLGIIVSSFLPGYVLLRLLNVYHLHSYFETLTLSFALSIAFTSIISSLLIPISERTTLILSIYVIFSFLPVIKTRIKNRSRNNGEACSITPYTCDLSKMLLLGLIILFFSVIIYTLYPQMAWVAELDIADNYSNALLFSRLPYSFSSPYPFFVAFEANVIVLSNSSMMVVKTALAYMSIMVILSFYVVSNVYLKKIDNRLPITATITWFLFSGFGWLSFLQQKLFPNNMSQTDMLWRTLNQSYADVGYGISTNLWLWFLPMTVSFTIFFTLLYLLKRTDITKRSFVAMFSLLIIALFFVHISELIMFVVLISVLSFLAPKIKLRLRDASSSTLIGLTGIILFIIYFSKSGMSFNFPYYLILAMFLLTLFTYLLTFNRLENFPKIGRKAITAITAVLLVLFLGGFFAWLSSTDFSMSYVIEIQFIPWLLYPVRLGIVGALALVGIMVVTKYRHDPVLLFVCLLTSAFLVGKLVSIINLYYPTGYWEWRFLFFVFAAASMLAPIIILRVGKILFKKSNRRLFLTTLLLGMVIISGFSSTFLTLEFQITQLNPVSNTEADALSYFSGLLEEGAAPSILTVPQSSSAYRLVPVAYYYSNILPVIWESRYPEVPLNVLYNMKYPNTYIYLRERDLDILRNKYVDGYIASTLLQSLPEAFNNSEVQIYKLLNGVPPVSNSKTVLVMPFNSTLDGTYFFAYDMLSLGGYNYTVMLDSDPNILQGRTIIIPSDKSTNIINDILQNSKVQNEQKFVILNTNGYGPLSRLFLKGETQITISVNSSTGIYLHPVYNYTASSSTISEQPIDNTEEFTVDNDAEGSNFVTVVDDTQTVFWTGLAFGNGSVGTPTLSNDPSEKTKGIDSLRMNVESGNKSYWVITHNFSPPANWSDKDFLSLNWYGTDSGKKFSILAWDSPNYFSYSFQDNWSGWKQLVIPLMKFQKSGTPSWANINYLDIQASPGVLGTWHLDQIAVSAGRWINITALIDTSSFSGAIKILVFNGSTYIPLKISDNASENIPADGVYFLDGSRADELYGDGDVARISTKEIDGGHQLVLSLKMPPEDGSDSETGGLSQSRFKIELPVKGFDVSQIVGNGREISLPTEFEVYPLSPKDGGEGLGLYANGQMNTTFAVRKIIGKAEIIYVNVYPLIKAMLSNGEIGRNLYPTLGSLLDVAKINLPKYDTPFVSWIMDDTIPFLIFREATLKGNVNVQSTSLLFPYEMNLERVNIKKDGSELSLNNVTSISINGENNINISAQEIKIGKGRGFYSSLIANNSEIAIRGEYLRLVIKLVNGSKVEINGGSEAKLLIHGQLQVYVREPRIQNDGESTFREAYAIHSYQPKLRALGQNLSIKGNVEFNLPLSDTYSFLTQFTWGGSVERQPPLLHWDELGSVIESIPWLIAAFFIVIYFLYPYRPAQKTIVQENLVR